MADKERNKDVTFESLRDTLDENALIEAALKSIDGDEQPMLTGLKDWIDKAGELNDRR